MDSKFKTKVVIEVMVGFDTEEDKKSYDAYTGTIRFGDDIFEKTIDMMHESVIDANGNKAMYETETTYDVIK